jgi:anaerobic C4-dicarboxylate transporter
MTVFFGAQLAGFAVGILHGSILARFGLYAECGAFEVTVSLLRYGAFGLFAATVAAGALQVTMEISPRRARVAPVKSVTLAACLAVWAWIELYAKEDGAWRRVGNVSNARP